MIKFSPEYFNLTQILHELLPLFEGIAGVKSIGIVPGLAPQIRVFGDKAMIGTVLRNLISNAIKFANPGGEIIISAVTEKNAITISVTDSGIGIPKNRIDKLFQISESYSTPGTMNEKGTGMD